MPRSAAKSADKRTPKQSIQVNTPPLTPPPAQSQLTDTLSKKDADETVAEGMEELKSKAMEGCLPPLTPAQSKLMDMLSKEHTDETVDTIMEELMSKVMEGCLKVDIERQLVPFTASWAKSYLTNILERQMCPDGGEESEESLRTEDSEPLPATLDAWVQGCVPIEADIDQIPAQTEPKVNQVCNVMAQTNILLKQSKKETTPRKAVINKVLSPRPPPKIDLKKKQQVHLTPKPVAGKLLPPLPYSAGGKEMGKEREDRTHSVCNYSTESLYQHNNKQPTTKLDPSSLPRHCIFPQYELIDDNHKKPNSNKTSGLSKHEPRYVKQQSEQLNRSKDQPAKGRNEADVWLKKLPPQGKERMVSSGPLRLDTMVLAKGVSLVDRQAVEISPLRCNPPTLSTKLRPIQSVAAVPMFSVDQFTTGQPPRVIPLLKSKNLDN
ncbi:uncharacterized protein C2orf81 homolog isoform X1 [Pseudochaenichthys georgianus]|uniref:uncharacterized protein C2orf81 homolog isoform X1 n=1 Tax=Pseudochaenichthys georgianus TaxID=52239 RepID=UPI00146D9AB2|nr:uncharacterized protein LOC117452064 isoform X1 [Pseudochaenichthys georgianus]